jgi:hypothetical protein
MEQKNEGSKFEGPAVPAPNVENTGTDKNLIPGYQSPTRSVAGSKIEVCDEDIDDGGFLCI